MAIIERQLSPPKYSDYSKFKPHLRIEFLYTCVYCGLFEIESASEDNFEVEHYVPQNKCMAMECDYSNLLYSCSTCNGIKSGYWPTKEQRAQGRYILNPCRHDVESHIDKSTSKWKGKTPEGKWNVKRFFLDSKTLESIRQKRQDEIFTKVVASASLINKILNDVGKKLSKEEIEKLQKLDRVLDAIKCNYRRLDSRRRS